MDAMTALPSIWNSLWIGAIATLAIAPLAIGCGYLLARSTFRGRPLVSTMTLVPLVLPPVVTGYLLLEALGPHSVVGQFLEAYTGLVLAFSPAAAVMAAMAMGFPLCGDQSGCLSIGSHRTRGNGSDCRSRSMDRIPQSHTSGVAGHSGGCIAGICTGSRGIRCYRRSRRTPPSGRANPCPGGVRGHRSPRWRGQDNGRWPLQVWRFPSSFCGAMNTSPGRTQTELIEIVRGW